MHLPLPAYSGRFVLGHEFSPVTAVRHALSDWPRIRHHGTRSVDATSACLDSAQLASVSRNAHAYFGVGQRTNGICGLEPCGTRASINGFLNTVRSMFGSSGNDLKVCKNLRCINGSSAFCNLDATMKSVAWRRRSGARERKKDLASLECLDLQAKFDVVASDWKRTLDYWPVSLTQVTNEELSVLPEETVEAMRHRLRPKCPNSWRRFRARLV